VTDISQHSTRAADGVEIGYFRRGQGPALVITHGSIATKEQWLPATEHLARDFTCFVHDRRGRGASGDAAAYSLGCEVDDIAAMMAVAGPGAHLLGHSFGALCTLAYAERHAIDGVLVLYEPPLAVDGPVAGPPLEGYRALVEAGDLDAALEHALIHFVRMPKEAIPMVRQTPLWGGCMPLTPTWVRELEQIDALGADLGHYAAVTARTHILAGLATTPFLLDGAHQLRGVIAGAKITEMPGDGHFAHVANPRNFAAAVKAAIERG